MAAGGIRSLVFIEVSADRSSGMNCGVHRPLPSAQISKCCKTDQTVLHSADNHLKHTVKEKDLQCLSPDPNSKEHALQLAKTNLMTKTLTNKQHLKVTVTVQA